MRERMFYFSHLASKHQFSRHEAADNWKVAGILEKAQKAILGSKTHKQSYQQEGETK